MRTYRFHSDPAHGWLEVPIQDILDLGIEANITSYSFMDESTGTAYLEEDLDMSLFIDALEGNGIEFQIDHLKQENDYSFIRDLDLLIH